MSIDRWLYIGAYLEIEIPITSVEKDSCAHQPKHKRDGFCDTCGTSLSRRFYTQRKVALDIQEMWGYALVVARRIQNPDCDSLFLVPNEKSEYGMWIEEHETGIWDLPKYKIGDAARAFVDIYNLKRLSEKEVPYHIKLGILQFFS